MALLAAIRLPGPTPRDQGRAGLGLRLPLRGVSASRVAPAPPGSAGSAAVARSAGRGRRRAACPALLAPALPLQRLGRPGGKTYREPSPDWVEGAAGLIVPPNQEGLQGTKGEIWVQSHAANSGLTPDSSTLGKSGVNQPVAGRWGQEVREQSSLVHTPVSPTRLPCITPLALTSLSSPPPPLHLFPLTWDSDRQTH